MEHKRAKEYYEQQFGDNTSMEKVVTQIVSPGSLSIMFYFLPWNGLPGDSSRTS
jgi:hypothetical protein